MGQACYRVVGVIKQRKEEKLGGVAMPQSQVSFLEV